MDDGLLFTGGVTLIQVGLALGLALVLERRTPRLVRWVVAFGIVATILSAVAWVVTGWTWNLWEYAETGEGAEAWQAAANGWMFDAALALGALTAAVVYAWVVAAAIGHVRTRRSAH